jgi:hypothetical protein
MIPAHIPAYREALAACSSIKTYVLHVSELCQMQWDYKLDWPDDQQPKIWIYAYRCFQRNDHSEEFKEVDQVPFDVPVWDDLIVAISHHAASLLYSSARIVGPLINVKRNYAIGAKEAANKRYDMRKYRKMMLANRSSE